ncbi:hypothetical protein ILUMI_01607 [Ignelater luminosus]|uniref:Elongator complex protein 5 n=1 Tax=Ignelater luminosus TaxID=2038154 RepID=A0A8K0GH94_IGNLU|nr:hypothetical protein ILUMI_01607 [Ignelater luminosus]
MLTTHLNNLPYSKFVLIEDSVEQRGKDLLKYIVESHINKTPHCKIKYFVFEGTIEKTQTSLPYPNVKFYDFVSDSNSWLNSVTNDFPHLINTMSDSGYIIVVDSLAHLILQYGIASTYKIFHELLMNREIVRIITILHQDLCENIIQTSQYFQHLATLCIVLEPKFNSSYSRVSYKVRKRGGKVLKKIEEFTIEDGVLKSQEIKKPNTQALIQQDLEQILPENLSTFKIGLTEDEKKSRAEVILPYLPKEVVPGSGDNKINEGKIFYTFDEVDDWDEEDPDDDLNI